MIKDPALFWEIFSFGLTYLGTLMWMLALLVTKDKDHTRRIAVLEHSSLGLADVRERVSKMEGRIEGRDEVKQAVKEWLSENRKGETQ